jgi:hypothetical protein
MLVRSGMALSVVEWIYEEDAKRIDEARWVKNVVESTTPNVPPPPPFYPPTNALILRQKINQTRRRTTQGEE